MAGRRSLPLTVLRAECEFFARSIRALCGGDLPEGVASAAPGGPANPAKGPEAVLVYYRTLVAEHARRTARADVGTKADAVGLGILAERPLTRPSIVQSGDGGPRFLTVHPKSFETLRHMAMRDAALAFLLPVQEQVLSDLGDVPSSASRLVGGILDEHHLLAWIAMHPGPGMPWDQADEPPGPEAMPEQVRSLTPIEIHQVRRLHEECNHHELLRVRELLEPPEESSSGLSGWSAFFSGAEELLGEPTMVLMRDRSLRSVIFRVQVKASERRRATAEAEAKRSSGER